MIPREFGYCINPYWFMFIGSWEFLMVKSTLQNGFLAFLFLVLLIPSSGVVSISTRSPATDDSNRSRISLLAKSVTTTHASSLFATSNDPIHASILLHYLIRLIGNDWLGADWVYIGLTPYRYPVLDSIGQQVLITDPITGKRIAQWKFARFWTDPGPASLIIGDTLWVWGYTADSHTLYADNIQVKPPSRVAPPADVSASGRVRALSGETISIQDASGIDYTVTVDSYTTFSFPPNVALPHPQQGLWVNISWLTGANGLLGSYDGFHGNYRGILRLDFSQP
jgi:hypothetical protein